MTIDLAALPKGEPDGGFDEIHLAARRRDVGRVAQLLHSGVDHDTRNQKEPNGDGGNTPLWFAAQGAAAGGVPVAEVLINAGATVDAVCEYGTTALHMAASWGHLDMIKCLITHGANPASRDENGRTPRQMAESDYAAVLQDPVQVKNCHPQLDQWLAAMPAVIAYLAACES